MTLPRRDHVWGRQILESHQMVNERDAYGARLAIAMLRDDDLGQARVLRCGIVLLLPIDEEYDIGVLFDRPAIAQV